ncbi:hypothetical protein, partial [Xenorhabdus szentirmaii]|uniref:hypothetical protein n=1 Tax=Xenorhabdus szentirmaii TaxID=290112 RepID=UPI002B410C2E
VKTVAFDCFQIYKSSVRCTALLSRREPVIVRLSFCCGVTFSGKPAKSDTLTPQTVSKSGTSVEMPAGTASTTG